MNSHEPTWRPVDLLVAGLVLATVATLVLVRSHYFGFLSGDSSGYLSLAQNLVDGHGYYQPALGKPDQLFAIWPVGYPTLIALVAKVCGLPVFEASKLLNVLLAGANLLLLKQIFDRDFPWFAWLLLLPPVVELSSYTWSEVPFTTGLIWLAVSATRLVLGYGPTWKAATSMALATAMLFLSRYIGAVGVCVIGLVALLALLRGDARQFRAAVTAAAAATVGVIAYLVNNLQATGHATGMQRLPAPEPPAWLAAMTLKAHLKQVNVLVASLDFDTPIGRTTAVLTTVVLAALAIYVALGRGTRAIAPDTASRVMPGMLVGTGLVYLSAITAMRWLSHFDSLSMRLLFPGTLLTLLGLVAGLRSTSRAGRLRSAVPIAVALGLTAMVTVDLLNWRQQPVPLTRDQKSAAVIASAAGIPPGSIVVFGDPELAYLRPDLLLVRPQFRPMHPRRQPWGEFITQVNTHAGNRSTFVFIEPDVDPQRFHSSVVDFMTANRGRSLVNITPR